MRLLFLIFFVLFQGCGWLKPAEPVREAPAALTENQNQDKVADPEPAPVSKPAPFPYKEVGLGILATLLGGTVLIGGPYLAYKWWNGKKVEKIFDTPEQQEKYEKLNPKLQKLVTSSFQKSKQEFYLKHVSFLTTEQQEKLITFEPEQQEKALYLFPKHREVYLELDEDERKLFAQLTNNPSSPTSDEQIKYLKLEKEEREKYAKNPNFTMEEKRYIFYKLKKGEQREVFAKLPKQERDVVRTLSSSARNEFLNNKKSRKEMMQVRSEALLSILSNHQLSYLHSQVTQIVDDAEVFKCFEGFIGAKNREFVYTLNVASVPATNIYQMFKILCGVPQQERDEFTNSLWGYTETFNQKKWAFFIFLALNQPSFEAMKTFVEKAKQVRLANKLSPEDRRLELDFGTLFFLSHYRGKHGGFLNILDPSIENMEKDGFKKVKEFLLQNSDSHKSVRIDKIPEFDRLLDDALDK